MGSLGYSFWNILRFWRALEGAWKLFGHLCGTWPLKATKKTEKGLQSATFEGHLGTPVGHFGPT